MWSSTPVSLMLGVWSQQITPVLAAPPPDVLMVALATFVCGIIGCMYLFKLLGWDAPPKILPLDDFRPFPLIKKEVCSHDTCRFTLGLPVRHVLGLPIGQHIVLKFTDPETNKPVQRSYTPVSMDTQAEEVELVIKVYRPNKKFPKGGLLSQHLDSLKINDVILMKGPKGHLTYKGNGNFSTKPLGKPLEERSCKYIGMMAGGTGITPMLQILQAIFVHPKYKDETTKVKLLYANQTPEDILVRKELEEFAEQFPDRFQLWYTVDRLGEVPSEWKYDKGFINTDMVKKHLLFDKAEKGSTQFFMCGPPPMIKAACLPALKECGFSEKDWSVF